MNELPPLFRLDGKVALVTGGARGFGWEIAGALAAAGAHVAVTSRTAAAARRAATELTRTYPVDAIGLVLDQRDHRRVAAAVARVHRWKSRIDVLVNNAGGGSGDTPAHLFRRAPKDAEDMIRTNLLGALFCCQEAGRIMAAQGSGKIINIASMAGLVGRNRRIYERNKMNGQPIDYAAAKAGMIGMTRDLAGLLSPMGVHVNAISPGGFQRKSHAAGFVRDYSALTPLGRMGRDGVDLGGAALFLAAPASDYITGHNLVVDGGFSIWR